MSLLTAIVYAALGALAAASEIARLGADGREQVMIYGAPTESLHDVQEQESRSGFLVVGSALMAVFWGASGSALPMLPFAALCALTAAVGTALWGDCLFAMRINAHFYGDPYSEQEEPGWYSPRRDRYVRKWFHGPGRRLQRPAAAGIVLCALAAYIIARTLLVT